MTKSPAGLDEPFKGRHFEREIIIPCVRWYWRFKLSYQDLVEMMAEWGLFLAHTAIMRWVQGFAAEFERRWLWAKQTSLAATSMMPLPGSIRRARRSVGKAVDLLSSTEN